MNWFVRFFRIRANMVYCGPDTYLPSNQEIHITNKMYKMCGIFKANKALDGSVLYCTLTLEKNITSIDSRRA